LPSSFGKVVADIAPRRWRSLAGLEAFGGSPGTSPLGAGAAQPLLRRKRCHCSGRLRSKGRELEVVGTPVGPRRHTKKEEWPELKVPAKFEQGGFTSRRRKDPKTLFPSASLGNPRGLCRPAKTCGDNRRAPRRWSPKQGRTSRNSSCLVCKKSNAIKSSVSIAAIGGGELIRSVAFP
jgi:hypothetical protein